MTGATPLKPDGTEAIVISETHWDRAWYLPFQQFRLKLVRMVDNLFRILEKDPQFTHFTFDGQTVVLEDYLEVRPQERSRLEGLVHGGRIAVGPWYVLPDVFLVSGEALIRNLMVGREIAQQFGKVMDVGYIPDPFGQISQLPQVLLQFGYDSVIFERGTGDEMDGLGAEFIWESTDGSEILAHWLPEGYGNIANLPEEVDDAVTVIEQVMDKLRPWSRIGLCLLMNGSDHLEAQPHLPKVIRTYNQKHDRKIVLSTLPAFVECMRQHRQELKRFRGEFRRSKYQNLLSGVYSARTYLKQANDRTQRLLERWVEPWCAAAQVFGMTYPLDEIGLAWKYLLKNHPHDDICGCSIDAVHEDMMQRFRWTTEIGEALLERAFETITHRCRSRTRGVVVFNPLPYMRSGVAVLETAVSDIRFSKLARVQIFNPSLKPKDALEAAKNELHISFVRSQGYDPTPDATREVKTAAGTFTEFEFNFTGMMTLYPQVKDMLRHLSTVYRIRVNSRNEVVEVWAHKFDAEDSMSGVVSLKDEHGRPVLVQELGSEVRKDDKAHLVADYEEFARVAIWAENVQGLGAKRYDLSLAEKGTSAKPIGAVRCSRNTIENDFVRVSLLNNGTMAIFDKRTGEEYRGLLEFEDSEDVGDEYDYCPAYVHKSIKSGLSQFNVESVLKGPLLGSLRVKGQLRLPVSATADLTARSEETVDCDFTTELTLEIGSPTVHVVTEFNNMARDHRLRLLFPTGTDSKTCQADSTFDVIERPIRPKPSAGWHQPVAPTYPLRNFVTMSSDRRGLTVTTTGTMEFEILEEQASTIAVTLLRCVGWLSTVNMQTRPESAGPILETLGGQCLGKHRFTYAVTPHEGDWLSCMSHHDSESFLLPFTARLLPAADDTEGVYEQGFVSIEPKTIKLSAFKGSEDRNHLVLRVWNIADKPEKCRVCLGFPVKTAVGARADESPDEALTVRTNDSRMLQFTVQPKRIATILLDRE
ncbi:MAG: hypothetical protein C4K49_08575 [Candidatus Thorarchaeota archaeon]|nr:MAG: hypothetical protein C4K49_08575 [Candidatus Thorarchaeota archaeon]